MCVHSTKVYEMIQFVLAIAVYFLLMNNFFDRSVRPIGKRLQRDIIPLPKKIITAWLLVAAVLFPMSAFVRARESDWATSESLAAMANLLGVVLGMCVNIH